MSDKTIVELTDQSTLERLWQLNGLARAEHALEKDKSALPGFVLAKALIAKECAEARVDWVQALYRFLAKKGISIADSKAIYTEPENKKMLIKIEPADLVDLADSENP